MENPLFRTGVGSCIFRRGGVFGFGCGRRAVRRFAVGNGRDAVALVKEVTGTVSVGGGEPAAAFQNEGGRGENPMAGFAAVGAGLGFGIIAGTQPLLKSLTAFRAGVFVDRHGKMGVGVKNRNGVSARADTPKIDSAAGKTAGARRPELLLGSGLGFADAFLDALGTAMTAAIKFLGTFDLFMGHEIAP